MLKRILAIIGIILIFVCILTTFITALVPFPGKSIVFPIMIAGCVFLPLILWLALWMVSFISGKPNIAAMNPESNNEIFEKDIKDNTEAENENTDK